MRARTVSMARRREVEVSLPPSKSYTNRALIAAALADGESSIRNPSQSLDTKLLIEALGRFGVGITSSGHSLTIRGCGGRFNNEDRSVYLGNAGTAVRFLTSLAAIAPGVTALEGDDDMNIRPIGDLLAALEQAGTRVQSDQGRTPLRITGGTFRGGKITLNPGKSSQFLSSLLLAAPYSDEGLEIVLTSPISSFPYIGMTLRVMEEFGIRVSAVGGIYRVQKTRYAPANFNVEADVSSSTIFGSAAAITGSTVRMPGVSRQTLQGDVAFYFHLERMGCIVTFHQDGVEITGPSELRGIEADLNCAPDSVPALAVTAAFARGTSVLSNIAQLEFKETDRLDALSKELSKIGATVDTRADALAITPGNTGPALIETYNDHRIAMSFAVAGLKTGAMQITNPECVEKSYPGFWNELEKFY